MRRYVRKRKGSAEALVVPTAAAARRKSGIISPELSRSSIQHKTRRLAVEKPEDSASPASSENSSVNSGHVLASCCSSTKFADLEQENEEVTVDILAGNLVDFRDSKEKTLSINDQAESGELESTAMALESKSRCRSVAEEMPTEAELEEFFATAEANLQKQFIDKFNYDIVKDEPLEGRYEWIQIQFSPLEES